MASNSNSTIALCSTENSDKAYTTSGSACLDFFTRIVRNAPMTDYIDAFRKAWNEDKNAAVQLLLNMRDVRTGKGEKLIPAVLLVYLSMTIAPNVYEDICRKVVEYGYWKDLCKVREIRIRHGLASHIPIIEATAVEIKLFAEQLAVDAKVLTDAESSEDSVAKAAISLCAKWAPSEKTHYDHHPMGFAGKIAAAMGLKPKEYRLLLSKLRAHLGVLEMLMSTQQYDKIDFSKLPSVAMMKLKHAFNRDANAEGTESDGRKTLHLSYAAYLKKLAEGKTKVNVKGIQPHELVSTYIHGGEHDVLVQGQWDAIKQRVKSAGAFRDVTAIVDVSGSMSGQPMEVAIALGILVAECTEGAFHGQVITFHDNPTWFRLHGSTLEEQVNHLKTAPWGGSTNMRATFDLILNQAKNAKLAQAEMVKTLFLFTDMQFNQACSYSDSWESTFEYAKRTYSEAGYELPNIVCWNLRTSNAKTMPTTQNESGFVMLSGFSAELLKCILTGADFSPLAMMRHVLEPYEVPASVATCPDQLLAPDFTTLSDAVTKSQFKKAFKATKSVVTAGKGNWGSLQDIQAAQEALAKRVAVAQITSTNFDDSDDSSSN